MTIKKSIEEELRISYLSYSMSVIISRALPNVKDGLKPVQKRILYSMHQLGYFYNKPTRKSASVIGYVQQKYHPHGDTAIYDALVRMVQPFSLLMPLVEGQGHFGSLDGHSAAAMRYTEVRLNQITNFLLKDINSETIDFTLNYDGTEKEPTVLPARFPNILINGSSGIAVGMATNIPSHNLGEVMSALIAMTQNFEMTHDDIMSYIKGPDFSSYGEIINSSMMSSIYSTGRGPIQMRGKIDVEKDNNKEKIIITQIPYGVNKAKLVEKIASLVNEKIIEGVSDLRDESNMHGIRVVIDLKKHSHADVIINQLWQYTSMQVSFGLNMLVIDDGMPKLMNIKQVLRSFITFRESVIFRRTTYLIRNAVEKAHILIGLSVAVANIDAMIAMIKSSKDTAEAREKLKTELWNCDDILPIIDRLDLLARDHVPFLPKNDSKNNLIYLTDEQARAILDMKLNKLTSLEKNKIKDELSLLFEDIKEYIGILTNKEKLFSVMREEFTEVKDLFAFKRKTQLTQVGQIDDESLILNEDIVVMITMSGYIKRVSLDLYKNQKRGGSGRSGVQLHDDDFVRMLFSSSTHTNLLFFSNIGKVYKLKGYKLPIGTLTTKGKNIVNILPLGENEIITNIIPVENLNDENVSILFVTSHGNIRRNSLSIFSNIQSNGKIAIKFNPDSDEELISVQTSSNDSLVLLSTKYGKSIMFHIDSVRSQVSRASTGVRGLKLKEEDYVTNATIFSFNNEEESQYVFSISSQGYAQRSLASDYRITNRGGSGIINMTLRNTSDFVVNVFLVDPSLHDIILMTNKGQIIRFSVSDVNITRRTSKGVRVIRLKKDELIKSATVVDKKDDDEVEEASDITKVIGDN